MEKSFEKYCNDNQLDVKDPKSKRMYDLYISKTTGSVPPVNDQDQIFG